MKLYTMINLDGLEEALTELNYPAMYILEEGEMAEDAFKKMMATGKLVVLAEDLPKVVEILKDPMFMSISTEQEIYDAMIKKTFGTPCKLKK
jgi:hypothetical protein